MIVYQALSTYQILECIEHRKCFHSKEEAVLILGTYIVHITIVITKQNKMIVKLTQELAILNEKNVDRK